MNLFYKIILFSLLFDNGMVTSSSDLLSKTKMPLKKFEICENLSELPFSEFFNHKKNNINFVITNDKECFIECDIVSAPKPIINWYKNGKLYKSHLDHLLDHTDDYINSKNDNTQIGWSSILSKIRIYSNDVGDEFRCEIINPCKNDEVISHTFTIPEIASTTCSKNYKTIPYIKNSSKNNIFNIIGYFNPHKFLYIKTPVITAATTMRMEYPGNIITLSCKNEAYPKAINKWEVIEGDDENESGVSIENFNFLKVLENGDIFFNTTDIPNDIVQMALRCNASNAYGWDSFISTILLVTEE